MSRRTKAKETVGDVVLHVQELLGKLKLVDNFDWGSLEGCRYQSTRKKWSKDTLSVGIIKDVVHVDGNRIVAYNEDGVELFSIGGDSPWKWTYKDQVVSVSMTQSAKITMDLGPMPYTERVRYRIFLHE